jgi:peptide/nickel transport system substrate-binding protein
MSALKPVRLQPKSSIATNAPIQKVLLSVLASACVLSTSVVANLAQARTIRFASQGDALSMDPHSLNEAVQLGLLNNVFEPLVTRGKDLKVGPALATKFAPVTPTLWRFELRKGVTFHDGTPFNADDVVFSLDRARGDGSDLRSQTASIKAVRKVDSYTIEIETSAPNPILPDLLTNVLMMSKKWAETNQAVRPVDRRKGTENAASFRANGTGPFRLRERQPEVRTTFSRNGNWWGTDIGNVTEAIFLPLANDATRVAALLTGEVDIVDPVPLQDVARVNANPKSKVLQGKELRVIFLGFDQARDELLFSNVKGKNPFKDKRVRQAFYQAIDIQTISSRVMRGASIPTGSMIAEGIRGYQPDMAKRLPYDAEASKRLLAEAGYPNGFEVTMNCPNDRYMNDSEICQAVVANLARVGITAKLQAEPKANYFPRVLKRDTSFFMLGWTPAGFDAHNMLFTVLGSPPTPSGARGQWNFGAYSNPKLDALAVQIQSELDEGKRNALISEALALHNSDVGHIPLHQQTLALGVGRNIDAFQRPDGFVLFRWITVK